MDIAQLTDKLRTEQEGLDIFLASERRVLVLHEISRMFYNQGSAEAPQDTPAQILRRKIKRSKNPQIKKLLDWAQLHGTTGHRDALSRFTEHHRLLSPLAFLTRSSSGRLLMDTMGNNPSIANGVLVRILHASRSLGEAAGFSTDLMTAHPIETYLAKRDDLIARIQKTGSFMQLIQKQERLLQRIGTTTDMVLNDPVASLIRAEDVEMFKSLWGAHVEALAKNTSTVRFTAPPILTYMLYEILFMYCDSNLSGMGADESLYRRIKEVHPLKDVVREIHASAIKGTQSAFFR